MRTILYAGGSIVVSDQVEKALLRYARALAKAGAADLVVIPAFTETHKVGLAHILIGPTSQIMSVPTEAITVDLDDSQVVEILESRTKNLDPTRPEWGKDVVDISDLTDFDWDF